MPGDYEIAEVSAERVLNRSLQVINLAGKYKLNLLTRQTRVEVIRAEKMCLITNNIFGVAGLKRLLFMERIP